MPLCHGPACVSERSPNAHTPAATPHAPLVRMIAHLSGPELQGIPSCLYHLSLLAYITYPFLLNHVSLLAIAFVAPSPSPSLGSGLMGSSASHTSAHTNGTYSFDSIGGVRLPLLLPLPLPLPLPSLLRACLQFRLGQRGASPVAV